jgi:hypothetical protein
VRNAVTAAENIDEFFWVDGGYDECGHQPTKPADTRVTKSIN